MFVDAGEVVMNEVQGDRSGLRILAPTMSSASLKAMSTTSFASWFRSRGRFAMHSVSRFGSDSARPVNFKLRHYPIPYPSNASNPASSTTVTPNPSALSSFDPASSPATT